MRSRARQALADAAGIDELRAVAVGAVELEAPHRPIAPGTNVDVCIRPEHVLLVGPEQEPHVGARRNLLPARIVREVAQGAFHTLYVRLACPIRADRDYDVEVDLPAHPYRAMGVAGRRDWAVSPTPGALHVVETG